MRFRHYEELRTFTVAARLGSVSEAAQELNLTKGAISHQIKALEAGLGFSVLHRLPRGVRPTQKGAQLLYAARSAFSIIDGQIAALRDEGRRSVTLGLSTYLASRWLSPRLMEFIQAHPGVRLRLQPMISLYDLERDGIDIAIRWGKGDWTDLASRRLFDCPAWPAAAPDMARRIAQLGLETVLADTVLLDDRDGSTAWAEWLARAGQPPRSHHARLTIPDPNVRVQAVIDGQGLAIQDALVRPEIDAGSLVRVGSVALDDYGYHLVAPPRATDNPDVKILADWLASIAKSTLDLAP